MLQKFIAPGLLLLLIIQWLFLPLLWQADLRLAQRYAADSLKEQTDLTSFKFTKEAYLHFLHDEHELLIEGELYDIKTTVFRGDSVLVTAKRDHWEEATLSIGKSLFTPDKTSGSTHPVAAKIWLSQPFLLPESLPYSALPGSIPRQPNNFHYRLPYSSVPTGCWLPPPDFCSPVA